MKSMKVGLAVLALAFAAPTLADHGHGKSHGHGQKHEDSDDQGHGKFDGDERGQINVYFGAHPEASQLPPGLAKQGKVPPGWQKKLAVGRPVPADLWEMRAPLPPEIVVKLPVPPPGVELIRIGDQLLKIRRETHEVLDRMGLPHPP